MSDIDKELIYWIVLSAFFMPLVLFGILIWFIHIYQTKKYQHEAYKRDVLLREQSMIIKHQLAIEEERSRIASEMHDDMGSGLTTIKYLSEKLESKLKDTELILEVDKIGQYSTNLIKNMSEIIWALNSRFDSIFDLVGYIRRHVSEYLEDMEMDYKFVYEGVMIDQEITGEKRRNIFLVVKELVHNAVKHSGAKKIILSFKADRSLNIMISEEEGVGFDPENCKMTGNGLNYIIKRIQSIGALINFENTGNGMKTTIIFPFDNQTKD